MLSKRISSLLYNTIIILSLSLIASLTFYTSLSIITFILALVSNIDKVVVVLFINTYAFKLSTTNISYTLTTLILYFLYYSLTIEASTSILVNSKLYILSNSLINSLIEIVSSLLKIYYKIISTSTFPLSFLLRFSFLLLIFTSISFLNLLTISSSTSSSSSIVLISILYLSTSTSF
jgi:hypothetical protein